MPICIVDGKAAGNRPTSPRHRGYTFSRTEINSATKMNLSMGLYWMVLHAVVIPIPGAGTFSAQRGVASFLIGIFAGFLLICIAVQLTRSLWAGALANMIANVFVNLYMLRV
jgi:hypothetical protein